MIETNAYENEMWHVEQDKQLKVHLQLQVYRDCGVTVWRVAIGRVRLPSADFVSINYTIRRQGHRRSRG